MGKPTFTAAWLASQKIYDPLNPGGKVAKVIDGDIAANIHDKKHPWQNTCAVRMSYILNQSGVAIPAIPGKTKGGDRRNYLFRVKDVISYLKQQWGKPEVVC